MKREIKFRGKVKQHDPMRNPENGWAEGYYFQNLTQGEMRSFIFQPPCTWEVIPETVGQFTGLLDKNGKEIYEGDVIQFRFTQFSSFSSKLFLSEQFIGIITVDKWNNHIIKSNGLEIHISNACEYGVVIGNIHDNPELLKAETL